MKYVHFLTNTFRPSRSTQMFTMTYMVLSDTRQLVPGNYTMTQATYEQAEAYARSIGAELIGCKLEKPIEESIKLRKNNGNISLKALDDARKIQGKGKYNTFTNYCYGDGYFARSCIDKYGERVWQKANEIVRGEDK